MAELRHLQFELQITNTDWVLQSADAINERGQIVGFGEKGGVAYRRAYLLTPDAPATVALVTPADGASFFGPTNLTVGALARDLDSGVRRVEFYANDVLIAADTNAPFSQVWSNVPGGSYTVTAVATDNRDLVRTSAPVSVTVVFPNQPLEVTDAAGASSLDALVVTITNLSPPVINCAANRTAESGQAWSFDPPMETDLCGGTNVVVTVVSTVTNSVFACTFTATRTWKATDASGNFSMCSQSIRVADTTAPTLVCPSNVVVDATNIIGAVATFATSFVEDCGSGVTMSCVPPSGATFPIGTTSVTCTIADASGNSNSCLFQVTVQGPHSIKQDVLAELLAFRAGFPGGNKQLDKAIDALISATDDSLWIDDNHLVAKSGARVFSLEKTAAQRLRNLANDPNDAVPDDLALDWIARLVNADRLLAEISVEEAASIGSSPKKLAEARELIAKGDADVATGRPTAAIAHYRTAWKNANKLQKEDGV